MSKIELLRDLGWSQQLIDSVMDGSPLVQVVSSQIVEADMEAAVPEFFTTSTLVVA